MRGSIHRSSWRDSNPVRHLNRPTARQNKVKGLTLNRSFHMAAMHEDARSQAVDPYPVSTTRRRVLGWASLGLLSSCLGGCRTAPITGRRQLMILPESEEVSLGLKTYSDVASADKESKNEQYRELVSRVGHRIAAVSGRGDYQWEFRTLASEEQNAFCLPGGKVAVYEGIIPVCQNEAGLAVVMSHEIAHALARHGGERMSQNAAVDGVKTAMSYAMQKQAEVKREAVLKAYGLAVSMACCCHIVVSMNWKRIKLA